MKNNKTKISLFILIGVFICACNTFKRVPDGKKLLVKNEILVNGKKEKNEDVVAQLYQRPNSDILGYRLRLNIYNLASQSPDSIYKAKFLKNPKKYYRKAKWLSKKQVDRLGYSFWYYGIHDYLKKTGEAPVIFDDKSTKKSALRLQAYYFDKGFFNTKVNYSVDSIGPKKASVKYTIETEKPYAIDTIKVTIDAPILDSLYKTKQSLSAIKSKNQFRKVDFDEERRRITSHFRNNGAFYFQQNNINYDIDTLDNHQRAKIDLNIGNQSVREGDSTKTIPFKLYKISKVAIYTDSQAAKNGTQTTDSVTYNNFIIYSSGKLKYRPKAITDAVFITKNGLFSDTKTTLTSRYLNNLRIFNYPSIQYTVDATSKEEDQLIASIFLTPRKKFSFGYNFDFIHSNIQEFGISGSTFVTIRNIFKGAETLDIAARGNIGASKDMANPNNNFFNVSEYGADVKLNFPRLFFPFSTEKIIPKTMIPSTNLAVGFFKQKNIGLDKENFTSSLTYNWTPSKNTASRFDLFNIQFVNNINTANYFNVYNSSYSVLNLIAQNPVYNVPTSFFNDTNQLFIESGTNGFINGVLSPNPSILTTSSDYKTIKSIRERKNRLTENNLIFASSFTYSKTTKTDITDITFYYIKTKIESAGNFLSLMARVSKQLQNQEGNNTIFDVQYSQFIKTEFEYIKHWDLHRKRTIAIRSFFGIAIPYGNSKSIPFSRSYFGGGSNDNRAWQSYGLGPGSSGATNDFNEANMKIAISSELRFNIFGTWNGALFVDAGNIWNVLDNVEDSNYVFSGLTSLKNSAIGSGFGLRKDYGFFVLRLDLGFKTYNPAYYETKKWFRDYNFAHSVINIGINYPF